MGMSAVIMAGLASTLYISTRTLTPDATATHEGNRSSLALSQLTGDLRLALGFTERTTKAVTFTVPDRTGDGAVETIRYSWTGTVNDPLLYQFNGGTAVTLAASVQQFNIASLTRTIPATSCAVPATIVCYAPHSEDKKLAATSVVITAPTGLVPGNVMLASVAVDGNVASTLAAPSGWTLLNRLTDSANQVTTAVWWKVAGASEPGSYTFTWTTSKNAYGWIARFSGVETSGPINVWGSTSGPSASISPLSPSVTTTVANTMIVRIGGFDAANTTTDVPGVSGHTTITMDRSDTTGSAASGGAAYVLRAATGATGTANFGLTASQEYVTFTLALAPDDGL